MESRSSCRMRLKAAMEIRRGLQLLHLRLHFTLRLVAAFSLLSEGLESLLSGIARHLRAAAGLSDGLRERVLGLSDRIEVGSSQGGNEDEAR
jgi:hypothetical protein